MNGTIRTCFAASMPALLHFLHLWQENYSSSLLCFFCCCCCYYWPTFRERLECKIMFLLSFLLSNSFFSGISLIKTKLNFIYQFICRSQNLLRVCGSKNRCESRGELEMKKSVWILVSYCWRVFGDTQALC